MYSIENTRELDVKSSLKYVVFRVFPSKKNFYTGYDGSLR